ncbi:MAG: GDP-mannose 4,6-dehydratase, partial [Actinomycetota bacterium]
MGTLSQAFDNLKGKRVIVTGDTGFKGSWLSLWLHMAGAQVHGYALAPEGDNNLFTVLRLDEIVRHQDGDVRDPQTLTKFMQSAEPEIVFHLAAQALV